MKTLVSLLVLVVTSLGLLSFTKPAKSLVIQLMLSIEKKGQKLSNTKIIVNDKEVLTNNAGQCSLPMVVSLFKTKKSSGDKYIISPTTLRVLLPDTILEIPCNSLIETSRNKSSICLTPVAGDTPAIWKKISY
jgi:hypothetical protein